MMTFPVPVGAQAAPQADTTVPKLVGLIMLIGLIGLISIGLIAGRKHWQG